MVAILWVSVLFCGFKRAIVSEECTASLFRMTESILVEAEVMWQEKKCFIYVQWFERIWPVTALEEGTGLS